MALTLEQRFRNKVNRSDGGCHLWTGSLDATGYGKLEVEGKTETAHRVAWWLAYGAWPDVDLDHLCRNHACVNVTHLEPVTRAENTRRGHASRRTEAPKPRVHDVSRRRICSMCERSAYRKGLCGRHYAIAQASG